MGNAGLKGNPSPTVQNKTGEMDGSAHAKHLTPQQLQPRLPQVPMGEGGSLEEAGYRPRHPWRPADWERPRAQQGRGPPQANPAKSSEGKVTEACNWREK